jgi:hypothetical protein
MIYILYRHTNHSGFGKNRPDWFSYEKSLNNILSTIEGLDFIKFHLMFDGECNIVDSRIHHTEVFKGGSDWASYCYTWNYAKALPLADDDYIYIAENDYAFIPGWPYKLKELIDTYDDLDYITLYDHSDKYNPLVYPNLHTYLYVTKTHHWRWVPNTTGSIIFSKRILNEDYDIHTSNPSDFGRFEFLRNTKSRNVLSPVPSLATHCEVEHLAPTINWEKIIQNDRTI